MIATILVIEVPKDVSGQVIEEWVSRYNDPENEGDSAYAMAIDLLGNIYVTGISVAQIPYQSDITTIAYDSSGNELWVATYDGPGNNWDIAYDIGVDNSGNIYVTGESAGIGSDKDFVTIKYDSLGNELWLVRYNGPGNGWDRATALGIDSSCNIYVAGWSDGIGTSYDYATIKYDQNGNELWVVRYNGPGNGEEGLSSLTIDAMGNVFVTGRSIGTGTGEDYATIKYDSNGNELWVARYNGPGNYKDQACSIACDKSCGHVFVTGESYGIGTSYDFATVAYNASGNELWVTRYDGPANSYDGAKDIVFDDLSGNIFLTGESKCFGSSSDCTTMALDSFGNVKWISRFNGPRDNWDRPNAITVDSSGYIYVTGCVNYQSIYEDYATLAYDQNGRELWVATYNGPGNYQDISWDIVVDSFGNVYVTGCSYGNGTYRDFTTIKYSQKLPTLKTIIDIDPDTLNLKSKGRWITCYIDLPTGYDVNDINISTIMLEDTIPAEWGDVQGETLMVKFDRSEVEDMLSPGTYNLKVTGELIDGISFEGYSDEIRVIEPP
jgi:hypothetical protein